MERKKATSIDEYISGFPSSIQIKLQEIRAIIRKNAPQSRETIKYAIPTFEQNGNLVHFAAFKNHIGFYPAPDGINAFKSELAKFDQSKGTIRFALDKPLPVALISKIVRFRVKQDREKAETRKKAVKRR